MRASGVCGWAAAVATPRKTASDIGFGSDYCIDALLFQLRSSFSVLFLLLRFLFIVLLKLPVITAQQHDAAGVNWSGGGIVMGADMAAGLPAASLQQVLLPRSHARWQQGERWREEDRRRRRGESIVAPPKNITNHHATRDTATRHLFPVWAVCDTFVSKKAFESNGLRTNILNKIKTRLEPSVRGCAVTAVTFTSLQPTRDRLQKAT